MEIVLGNGKPRGARADLLVVAAEDALLADLDRATGGHLLPFLRRRRFRAKGGSPVLYQSPPRSLPQEYVLVCPVHTDPQQQARATADAAVQRGREVHARSVAVAATAEAIETLAETLDLASYRFHGIRSSVAERVQHPAKVTLLAPRNAKTRAALERGRTLAAAALLARDLVNLPAEVVTPSYLANSARSIARRERLRVRVFDERRLRSLGMGALLGVARGSVQPPRFIELVYRPRRAKRRIAIVGKGITFDSGGLSLKSGESMQTQKKDMSGAAVVLGVMSAVRRLGIDVEVRGYISSTENMPSGSAIKPGDVLRAYNGKTIEVLNTDAEGRLVLADALSFAATFKPDAMIDFATLTAAVRTALGPRYAAILASDSSLAQQMIAAAAAAGEKLWQLPLADEYRHDIDSSIADLKNTGEGHSGTIIGGLFLREFTAGLPWAHVDFSSTAVTEKPFPGHPRGASGFGVRTTLRYLLGL